MALEEVLRRTEKYQNGEERFVCMLCGDVHFQDLRGILIHLSEVHAVIHVILNTTEMKGYRQV